jgi:small ligand-binding sensory domain FIST
MQSMSTTPPTVRCAAALSTASEAATAAREACRAAMDQLRAPVDLAFVFVSHFHAPHLQRIADILADTLQTVHVLGCTGESIVGNDLEIEDGPALSLWIAHLPGTTIETMHLNFEQTPDGGSFVGWPENFVEPWPEGSVLLALADPFSFPADALLERLNEDHPGVPVLGGMASGGFQPQANGLFWKDQVVSSGAVIARLHGGVRIESVVSQGCRPIGKPLVITQAERNLIQGLGGQPALAQLGELFPQLTPEEQRLARTGLHVGRVTSEYRDEFRRGDFLIRNVLGADPDSGAIAIGDYFRPGQTVQFHVRDERSADEDLQAMLARAASENEAGERGSVAGALLFTCNGRGTRLFSAAHHDAGAIQKQFPALPVAGLFAQGEIGPVCEQNYLHGFTASIALFVAPKE